MAAVHWIEILKCDECGRTGLAELWDHDAYEGQADIVPPGFRRSLNPKHHGAFYCIGCQVLVTSVRA